MAQTTVAQLREATLHGVIPAMATPVAADGVTVNVDVVPQLVDFLIERGVKGLFVGGTTGEGMVLPARERMRLHEAAVDAGHGRVPILLHVGSNTLAEARVLAQHAGSLSPAGIVALTPIFYSIPSAAILVYFQTLAAINPAIPFFAYDMPHLAINEVDAPLLVELQRSIPNFAGIKSSRHNAKALRPLLAASRPDQLALIGFERLALGNLSMGATGMISGLATAIPEPFVALGETVGSGDLAAARAAQAQINALLDLIPAGYRIGAIKQILAERGVPVGPAVPPRPMPPVAQLWQRAEALL